MRNINKFIFLCFLCFLPKLVFAESYDNTTAPLVKYTNDPLDKKSLGDFGINFAVGAFSLINTNIGNISIFVDPDPNNRNRADLSYKDSDGFSGRTFNGDWLSVTAKPVAGGSIFIDTYIEKDINISNSIFDGNGINTDVGSSVGGAIASFIDDSYSLNISGTTFNNNSVVNSNGNPYLAFNDYMGMGGAIFTTSNVNISDSIFSGNSVLTNGYRAYGGAIANYGGTVTVKDTSFYNNSVNSESGSAIGGAISNTNRDRRTDSTGTVVIVDDSIGATLNIIAENKDVIFEGNTAKGVLNDIYNKGGSTTNLNAAAGKSITFRSGIDGDVANASTNKVIINQSNSSGVSGGTIVLDSNIKNNMVEMYGGTLNFASATITDYFENAPFSVQGDSAFSLYSGTVGNVNLGDFTNSANISLLLDVDLDNLKVDSISANNSSSLQGNKFTIGGFNVIADSMFDTATIDLDDIFTGVDASDALASTYANGFPTVANGSIYTYDVNLNEANNTVDFVRRQAYVSGFNPYLYNQTVSMRETANAQNYITQNILNRYNPMFEIDVKKLIISDRVKYRSDVIAGKNNHISKVVERNIYNLVRVDSREDAIRLLRGENVYGELVKEEDSVVMTNNEYRSNVWVSILGLKDTSKYDDFPSVRNDFFTALIGIDSKTKKLANGVKVYSSAYLGYLRGNEKYTDNKIENNGLYIGTSGFARYDNIFMALTTNIGFLNNEAKNKNGKDKYDNYWFGIGTKFGYNYNIKNSTYSIEPSVYLSYIFVNAENYNSKSGVRIKQNNLNSFQIAPSLKLSKAFKNNLLLSVKAKYVIELVNDLDVRADNILLPELTNDPFIEYGISLDKRIKDRFALNVELNRRDGGRHGWIGGLNARFFF